MMRLYQSPIPADALGSSAYETPLGRRYASFQGISHDLATVDECLQRIAAILAGERWDRIAATAFTWNAVLLYARCWESASDGRGGALGKVAFQSLSDDERALHNGLLTVRDQRFAHAGNEAKHRCIVFLRDSASGNGLSPGFEFETPTMIVDTDQVALARSLVAKLMAFAAGVLAEVTQRLQAELDGPDAAELAKRIRSSGTHETPEAIAVAMLRALRSAPLAGAREADRE